MHQVLHEITLAAAATAQKPKTSFLPTIIMMALFAGVYFFFLRPKRAALKKQQAETRTWGMGDEIVTIGGIVGTVLFIDDDNGQVLVSTGLGETQTHLMFLKQAIKGRAPAKVQTQDALESGDDDSAGATEQ